jgi:hypothetical protein
MLDVDEMLSLVVETAWEQNVPDAMALVYELGLHGMSIPTIATRLSRLDPSGATNALLFPRVVAA